MIQLVEAPPGSGKSYLAVNYLVGFTKYDDLYKEFVLNGNVLIITNIEGLKIKHWNLDSSLASRITDEATRKKVEKLKFVEWGLSKEEKTKVLVDFFSIDNFEKIMEKTGKNHVILAIDECHEFFPAGYVNDSIYQFFAYHRHIGLDIMLLCQSLERTSRMFNPLLEYVVKARPRSRSLFRNFSYSYVDLRGRFLYSKTVAHKQMVFNAYKSFRQDEKVKPKNAVKHWIFICLLIFVCAGGLFKSALAIVKGKSEDAAKRTAAAQKQVVAPPAPVQPSTTVTPVPAPAVASSSPKPVYPHISTAHNQTLVAAADLEPSYITVKGYIKGSKPLLYLLSDGRCVSSTRNYTIGQLYLE